MELPVLIVLRDSSAVVTVQKKKSLVSVCREEKKVFIIKQDFDEINSLIS